ncbi:MAG: aminotransferase class V-fold PLP-dependent enzyme, partial [Clostridia bacterium]|nr:aminotransferase class V-fold PLP-dependent enzyme [Clostridia bacterium]
AVVISHASNLTGNVVDINAVGEICKRKGVKLIIDAAQTAGLIPVSIKQTGASAICFSGHKSLYGPQGTGGIVLGNGYIPKQIIVGGSGSESFSQTHPTVMPDALEAGTQNAHGIAGLLAGINYIKDLDGQAFSKADKLARQFAEGIKNIPNVILYGDLDAPLRTPVVTINIEGINSSDVAAILAEKYQIGVRAGAHCAPLMHKTLGTQKTGAVRFSFSHFNDEQQISLAIQAVKQIALTGGK